MKDRKCASCGHVFTERPLVGAFNTFIGEPTQSSSLFGSGGCLLCKECGQQEERIIEEEGTNYIPWLLNLYKQAV